MNIPQINIQLREPEPLQCITANNTSQNVSTVTCARQLSISEVNFASSIIFFTFYPSVFRSQYRKVRICARESYVTVAQINAPHNIRIIWWQEQEFNISRTNSVTSFPPKGELSIPSILFLNQIRGFRLLHDEISPCCHTGGCCSHINFLCCSTNSVGATHYPTCATELAITYCVLS